LAKVKKSGGKGTPVKIKDAKVKEDLARLRQLDTLVRESLTVSEDSLRQVISI